MRISGVTTLEDNVVIGASGGSKTLTLNGKSVGPGELVYHEDHMLNFVQLGDDVTALVWGKEYQSGGTGRYILPQNPVDGQEISVYTANASSTGDITLKCSGSQEIHHSSVLDSNAGYYASSTMFVVKGLGRHFSVIYISTIDKWLIAR
jgi:hypothetical protein